MLAHLNCGCDQLHLAGPTRALWHPYQTVDEKLYGRGGLGPLCYGVQRSSTESHPQHLPWLEAERLKPVAAHEYLALLALGGRQRCSLRLRCWGRSQRAMRVALLHTPPATTAACSGALLQAPPGLLRTLPIELEIVCQLGSLLSISLGLLAFQRVQGLCARVVGLLHLLWVVAATA